MTGDDLQAAINGAGLDQVGLARLLRVDPRTVRRWVAARADHDVPHAVAIVVTLLATRKDLRADILALADDLAEGRE